MRVIRTAIMMATVLAAGAATSAAADVKAGVDAWGRGEYRKAVEEWRGPALAGDADAQFNLAQAYKLGRGVPVDTGLAEEWYRKAAVQGHQQAGDNYGLALFQNNKRDRAVEWLEKSAARGEPRAQFVLGTMYFNADVVKRDWVRAYALMTRASAAGLPQATSTLAQMDRYIGLNDRQRGTELARRYEQEASRPRLADLDAGMPAAPPSRRDEPALRRDEPAVRRSGAIVTTSIPPSVVAQDPDVGAPPPPARPRPAPPNVGRADPRLAPAPVAGGAWRVQLGAFRDVGNARGLFSRLARGPLAGRQQYLVKSGAVTRLLAGPYGSQAEAARACGPIRAAGSDCVPTKG
jgi:hypothetical protein